MSARKDKRPSVAGRKVAAPKQDAASASGAQPAAGQSSLAPEAKQAVVTTAPDKPTSQTRQTKGRPSSRLLVAGAAILGVLALITGLLSWNQWLRYDDAADFQGTWLISGSSATLTITDTQIMLSEGVSYDYVLDTFGKTIEFTYSGYSGQGSYAFSPERTELVITERDAETGESTSTKLVRP